MSSPKKYIVWEWEDEMLYWRPYEPHISNFIETNANHVVVNLANVDHKMRAYTVDTVKLIQVRNNTGTKRSIIRHEYPENSLVVQGITWAFEGDRGHFQPYAIPMAEILEETHVKGIHKVDLSIDPRVYMPYKINLRKMEQKRIDTKKRRRIRRDVQPFKTPYMSSTAGLPPAGLPPTVGSLTRTAPASTGGAFGVVPGASASTLHSHTTAASTGGGTGFFSNVMGLAKSMIHSSGALFGAPATPSGPVVPSAGTGISTGTGPVTRSKVSHTPYPSKSAMARYRVTMAGPASSASLGDLPLTGSFSNMASATVKQKRKTKDSEFYEILKGVVKVLKDPPKDEECCICMCELDETSHYKDAKHNDAIQLKCGHNFHQACLKAMYDHGHKDESVTCPSCKRIYGIKQGICPAGTMSYVTMPGQSVPGHEGYATIRVMYDVRSGIQGPEHPNPGKHFHCQGFPRIGFLPASPEGIKMLKLLIKAWERRLTFTIGTSVTTGMSDCVVWNGIHHKTEINNHSGHGYPAPGFLQNVKAECADLGVYDSEDEMEEEEEAEESKPEPAPDSDDSDL